MDPVNLDADLTAEPSTEHRRKPGIRQIKRLSESLKFAPQADGGAIVYPYMLLWRGYRLTPDQVLDFRSWDLTRLDARTKEEKGRKLLLGFALLFAAGGALGLQFAPSLRSSLFFAAAAAFAAWSILWLRHRDKRAFANRFPEATERVRDPSRSRKWLLLLMLTPLYGHISTSLTAPLFIWLAILAVVDLAPRLTDGSATGRDVATTVVIGALAAGVTYFAIQHIVFRVRNGRPPSIDDFNALHGAAGAPLQSLR